MEERKKLTKVLLADYFEILAPKQADRIRFNIMETDKKEGIPFLGRSAANNGIVAVVEKREEFINEGNVITIALDGSTGATFYQYHAFSSGQNIWILKHKSPYLPKMTPAVALFLVTSIRKAVKGYTWNLSLTKTRLKKIRIYLPLTEDGRIDAEEINRRMRKLRNSELIERIRSERFE